MVSVPGKDRIDISGRSELQMKKAPEKSGASQFWKLLLH
jgi:hypothetical protein